MERDREDFLDPERLAKDADEIISLNGGDARQVVIRLLRDVRLNVRKDHAVAAGHLHTVRQFEEDVRRAEVRGWYGAYDLIRRLRPSPRTQLTYDGFRGQAERQFRDWIKWLEQEIVHEEPKGQRTDA